MRSMLRTLTASHQYLTVVELDMTAANHSKKSPAYKTMQCRCGATFSPASSRQKHCCPLCRFKETADSFSGVDSCWTWPKSYFKSGYGQFSETAKKPEYAHRMAYKAFFGPIPDGMYVCHKCDNPACFNPAHLFLGEPVDNVNDMWAKGRQQKYTNNVRGPMHHSYGKPFGRNQILARRENP